MLTDVLILLTTTDVNLDNRIYKFHDLLGKKKDM